MHRGSKYGTYTPLGQFRDAGGGGVGDSGTREHAGLLQGAEAGNQQRVWMLATEMGEKGVSGSTYGCAIPQDPWDLWPMALNCVGCCPPGGCFWWSVVQR